MATSPEVIDHQQIHIDACKILLAYGSINKRTVTDATIPYGDLVISIDDGPTFCHSTFDTHPYVDPSGFSEWYIDSPSDPEDAKAILDRLVSTKRDLLETSRSIIRIILQDPKAIWTSHHTDDINPVSMIGLGSEPNKTREGAYLTYSFNSGEVPAFQPATNLGLLEQVQTGLHNCSVYL